MAPPCSSAMFALHTQTVHPSGWSNVIPAFSLQLQPDGLTVAQGSIDSMKCACGSTLPVSAGRVKPYTNPDAHLKKNCLRQVSAGMAPMPCSILSTMQPRRFVRNKVFSKPLNRRSSRSEREIIGGFAYRIIPQTRVSTCLGWSSMLPSPASRQIVLFGRLVVIQVRVLEFAADHRGSTVHKKAGARQL